MFSLFRHKTQGLEINAAGKQAQESADILLLDVRKQTEFNTGHLPGSLNLPLDKLGEISRIAPEKVKAIYVYCQSGARSAQAANMLQNMGYTKVSDLGGIVNWRGPIWQN